MACILHKMLCLFYVLLLGRQLALQAKLWVGSECFRQSGLASACEQSTAGTVWLCHQQKPWGWAGCSEPALGMGPCWGCGMRLCRGIPAWWASAREQNELNVHQRLYGRLSVAVVEGVSTLISSWNAKAGFCAFVGFAQRTAIRHVPVSYPKQNWKHWENPLGFRASTLPICHFSLKFTTYLFSLLSLLFL